MRRGAIRNRSSDRAVTLVEVVAALVLLSTTVVTLLLSHSRAVHQIAIADERAQVAAELERMLAEWTLTKDDLRISATGELVDHPNWYWQREATLFDERRSDTLYRIKLQAERIIADSRKESSEYAIEWLYEAPDS